MKAEKKAPTCPYLLFLHERQQEAIRNLRARMGYDFAQGWIVELQYLLMKQRMSALTQSVQIVITSFAQVIFN